MKSRKSANIIGGDISTTLLVLIALILASCSFATSTAPTATPALPTDVSIGAQPGRWPLYVVINPVVDVEQDLQNSFVQTANGLGADAKM